MRLNATKPAAAHGSNSVPTARNMSAGMLSQWPQSDPNCARPSTPRPSFLRPGARWPPSPPVTSPVESLSFRRGSDLLPALGPFHPADVQLPTPNTIEFDRETDGFNKFERAIFRRYEQEIEYSTSAYAETLRTYSATQALPPSVREGLIGCITTLINQR
jgi:hypothetical protein